MKKDVTMKKTNFVKGAFITTFGIVLAKLLGAFYVIPFHALIGEAGGALYGYAYTVYTFFMSFATAGIPFAISKLVSEYQALGYFQAKLKVFRVGKLLSLVLGLLSFFIVFFFAPILAKFVLGNVEGGNQIEDVIFVIRVIAASLLIVPILGIYRGYFEGHRYMTPPSVSQVIEQIIRILIILCGSYLGVKTFHLPLKSTVGISLFGTFIGAFSGYFYLVLKKKNNHKKFQEKIRPVNEPIVTNQVIFKKIISYALPFIMIDVFKSLYNLVDMFVVVKKLVSIAGYSAAQAEMVYGMLSTWANKFSTMVLALSTGVIVSLVPNLTESLVKKDEKRIQKTIIQTLSILLFFLIPLTLGISFLSTPIWKFFYGDSIHGPSVLGYHIFTSLFISLFTTMIIVLQILKEYRTVAISLISGFLLKLFLNHNLILTFYHMEFPPYYGVITASIIGYFVSFLICIIKIRSLYQLRFEDVIKSFIDILCGSVLMILLLSGLKLLLPFTIEGRIINFFYILLYGVLGFIIYGIYTYKVGLIDKIFGKRYISNLMRKIGQKK